jgi:membrane protein DedA with SNARE-associated domain
VHLGQILLPLIASHGLPIVALMVFLAELGLPTGISPKVGLLIAGSMALHTLPGLAFGLLAVSSANVLGAMALYFAARTGGTRIIVRIQRRRPANAGNALERWRARLGGHDAAAVFVGRIVPMVRIYVTIASGLARMSWQRFLLGSAPAGLVWSGTPLLLGYYFRGSVRDFTDSGSIVSHAFFIAVPMIGVVMVLFWAIKRHLSPTPRSRRP